MITHEQLTSALSYDQQSGTFTWVTRRSGVTLGKQAGNLHPNGYRYLRINGNSYLEHRLVWFYVHNRWPSKQLDHINGNRADNRITNLREVSSQENMMNKIEHRAGKLAGAYYRADIKKWRSQIEMHGKRISLGYFSTAEEAHSAYLFFYLNNKHKLQNPQLGSTRSK